MGGNASAVRADDNNETTLALDEVPAEARETILAHTSAAIIREIEPGNEVARPSTTLKSRADQSLRVAPTARTRALKPMRTAVLMTARTAKASARA